jgi:hypothetical protein
MTAYNGVTTDKENVQADSAQVAPYYTSFAGGTSTHDSAIYDAGFAAGVASVTPSAPTISDIEPASGQPVYPDTPISFNVTDVDSFSAIIPMIILNPYGTPEPVSRGVADGDFAFEALYSRSTRIAITNGYRYTIRRRGGWPAAPRLQIWATDLSGGIWIGP